MLGFRSHHDEPPAAPAGVFGLIAGQALDQVRATLRAELDRALILGGLGLLAVMTAGSVLVFALWALLSAEWGAPT